MTTKTTWFHISGLDVTVPHNEKTREIWDSYERPKSTQGRQAIIEFAIVKGFIESDENVLQSAFAYLKSQFPGANNSWIIREALIQSSLSNDSG